MKVPAGVEDGMRIRLNGEGEVGPSGGPPGDLYIEVHEREHPQFEREGDDLHCQLKIPMTTAVLGATVDLQTLDSEEKITIKSGTQPGATITLNARGRAAPASRRPRRSVRPRQRRDPHADRRRAGEAHPRARHPARRGQPRRGRPPTATAAPERWSRAAVRQAPQRPWAMSER